MMEPRRVTGPAERATAQPVAPRTAVPAGPLTGRDGTSGPRSLGAHDSSPWSRSGAVEPGAGSQSPAGPGRSPRAGRTVRILVQLAVIIASTGTTGWLVGSAARSVAGSKNAPWILGRASGICTYLLLVALVLFGLVLSHPWRARWRRPSTVVRIRAHVSLAAFTLAFLLLHIVVLATDEYAKVGWWGALLPMASDYRPMPVTLGVIACYAGLAAGVTAAFAGRWASRVWWPVHKIAAVSLVLAWLHGVLAGTDSAALGWLYAVSAAAVLALAVWRYTARTPADRVRELVTGERGRVR